LRTVRHFRPGIERLDDRVLPSAATSAALHLPAAPPAVVLHPTHAARLTLVGQVSGTWSTVPTVPDVGQVQKLSGSGTVSPLGTVQVRATLRMPGFIFIGRATGRLVLSSSQGTVTLQLTGPLQAAFGPPPGSFTYRVTGGTGAYVGDSGQGTATFQESTSSAGVHMFTLTFQPATPPPLLGPVSGVWSRVPLVPDVGQLQRLSGGGVVSPLGTVTAHATLTMPGFILVGQATGTVTLSNANGSVTIQLTGPAQPGFSAPPAAFSYKITGGTGAYAGESGQGTASFQETTSGTGGAGTFTLTFDPAS
jgi:hypothetical protein